LIMQNMTYNEVNQEIIRPLGSSPGWFYKAVMVFWLVGILVGASCWAYQIATGLGVAGVQHPVVWGTYLVNFVFWVGIAHSGTLISAILFLFRARWRTAIARSSEAMTIFAIMTAGLFPFIHLGRPWVVYWILPYPNERNLWPNFQSPLVFDVIAISTYLTVSILFWYTGLIPDLATLRDQSTGLRRKLYGFFSLNWTGASYQWHHYGWAYVFFAALATPLVISVHSVVSWDFALSILPGFHSTIFAPYFVAGAIHSGLAMVLILLIPLRHIYRFENIITMETLENIAKTIVFTGLIMGYSYATEHFMAWYSGNVAERDTFLWRAIGYYAPFFWLMLFCNSVAPLFYFFKKIRTNLVSLYAIAVLIVIGMWYERYVIIIESASHANDPYSWAIYHPTWVDYGILYGSCSLFIFLFLLFAKYLPTISIAEVKEEVAPPMRGVLAGGGGGERKG
jgi:Ni/Fe-hydrogenase subunit HybB-like protein